MSGPIPDSGACFFTIDLRRSKNAKPAFEEAGLKSGEAGKVCCATQSFPKSPPKCKRFLRKAEPCRVAILRHAFPAVNPKLPKSAFLSGPRRRNNRKSRLSRLVRFNPKKGGKAHSRNAKPATKGGSDIRPKPGKV
jgi:hypothetical protein